MSMGGPRNKALDAVVEAAVEAGLPMVVSAGNDNKDACEASPAGVHNAITVASTAVVEEDGDQHDVRSDFSNWGKCVDVLAPGTLIMSSWIGSVNATRTISGTSMATPHVAGVVAAFLSKNLQATPQQVVDFVLSSSTKGLVEMDCVADADHCTLTPNKLLFWNCLI